MNLEKMYEIQAGLKARIEKEHPFKDGYDELILRPTKKLLAFLVELGECANEHRGFKFWSKDQNPRYETKCHSCKGIGSFNGEEMCLYCSGTGIQKRPLLEEYVDGLHFLLELGIDKNQRIIEPFTTVMSDDKDIDYQFIGIYGAIMDYYRSGGNIRSYKKLFRLYFGLGEMLGFTPEQIEQAYYEKNTINILRQDSGY